MQAHPGQHLLKVVEVVEGVFQRLAHRTSGSVERSRRLCIYTACRRVGNDWTISGAEQPAILTKPGSVPIPAPAPQWSGRCSCTTPRSEERRVGKACGA